jgi:hypothetical protein
MSRSIQPRIPRSAWSSCSLTAHPFRTRTPPTYEQPAVNVSPRWNDLSAERAPYVSAREGRPWLRSAPVPDEANRHTAHGAEGVDIAAASAGLCTSFTWRPWHSRRARGLREGPLELRATASPRSRRLRRCFPVSKSSSRLPPEEAVLERHLREICPLRERLRGFKSSQSVQHRLTS